MLLSEDDLQALKKLSLKSLTVQISFDGATAAVHDLVRGAGAFDQTLRAVERLVDYGFGRSVTLFFTEMHHNLQILESSYCLNSLKNYQQDVVHPSMRC